MDKKNPGYLPGPICCLKLLRFYKQDPAPFGKVEIIKRIKPGADNCLHDMSNIRTDWNAKKYLI